MYTATSEQRVHEPLISAVNIYVPFICGFYMVSSVRILNLSAMAPNTNLVGSTPDTGYTLSLPPLENPFTSDESYGRVLGWYLPPDVLEVVKPRLTQFGAEAVSDEVNEWISNAEKEQPYVKTRNVWAERYPYDRLITSHGWKEVGKWGSRNGYVACPHFEPPAHITTS